MSDNLGDRIRARRDARDAAIAALKTHLDEQFAKLHARLDEREKK